MTLDWQEAQALVREAEQAGVAFCVSQNYRYQSQVVTLLQALASGKYGTPHLIDLICHRHRPEPRTLDYPGAMVWDMVLPSFRQPGQPVRSGGRGDCCDAQRSLVGL